jgi:branched-chain amino acid transport system substrate-binding protein
MTTLRLRLGLVLAFVGLASLTAAQAPPVKIGLLLPYTGVLSVQGQDVTRGVELAVARAGGKAGGRELQVIREDTEGKPDVGLTKIKKLVERDRVDFVIGPVNSAVAVAIRGYVHEQGVPLIVPVAATRVLTAPPQASPWIFRMTDNTDQTNYPMGAWLLKHTKYRKLVVMATDFVAGRDSAGAFVAGLKAVGGEVVREIYAPLGTPDFAPYLAQVGSLTADAVWGWFPGADAIRFVKQYKEYGLATRLPLIGHNVLADDVILPAIGEAALGLVTIGTYTATIDSPENRAFVKEYEGRHQIWPTRYSEQGYLSTVLAAEALESLKGDLRDRARVREALAQAIGRIKAPRGAIRFDQYNQLVTDLFVTRVERQGPRLVNAIVDRIPAVTQESTWIWWRK